MYGRMLTDTVKERETLAWPQSPTQALGEKLYSLFQATSDFQGTAFQESDLENVRVSITSLISLCERYEIEFQRLKVNYFTFYNLNILYKNDFLDFTFGPGKPTNSERWMLYQSRKARLSCCTKNLRSWWLTTKTFYFLFVLHIQDEFVSWLHISFNLPGTLLVVATAGEKGHANYTLVLRGSAQRRHQLFLLICYLAMTVSGHTGSQEVIRANLTLSSIRGKSVNNNTVYHRWHQAT